MSGGAGEDRRIQFKYPVLSQSPPLRAPGGSGSDAPRRLEKPASRSTTATALVHHGSFNRRNSRSDNSQYMLNTKRKEVKQLEAKLAQVRAECDEVNDKYNDLLNNKLSNDIKYENLNNKLQAKVDTQSDIITKQAKKFNELAKQHRSLKKVQDRYDSMAIKLDGYMTKTSILQETVDDMRVAIERKNASIESLTRDLAIATRHLEKYQRKKQFHLKIKPFYNSEEHRELLLSEEELSEEKLDKFVQSMNIENDALFFQVLKTELLSKMLFHDNHHHQHRHELVKTTIEF